MALGRPRRTPRMLVRAARERRVAAGLERAADELAIEPRRRARDRHRPRRRRTDRAWPRRACACTGGAGRGRASRIGPSSTISPAYITAARVAHLGDDRQVVRDEDQRQAEVVREAHQQLAGSAPAPSRRAPSSARRRAAPWARRRAPSRSPPAGACRPRTRAGSGRRACPRCRPARAARAAWARAARPEAIPCSSIGSTICAPIVLTGLNAFIAPWKTIAMSRQRCGLTDSSPVRQMSSPSRSTRARRRSRSRQEAHQREDRRRLAAARLADEAHPLARAQARSRRPAPRAAHGRPRARTRRGDPRR